MTATRTVIQGGRSFHPSILHDGQNFRLFYHQTPTNVWGLYHRQSPDAVTWGPQSQVLPPPGGGTGYGSSVLDEGPTFSPASERYKLAYYNEGEGTNAVHLAVSADGLHWTHKATLWTLASGYASDILTLWRNPLYPTGGFVYGLWINHVDSAGNRQTWVSHCQADFSNWTTPDPVFQPDAWDSGVTQFYGCTAPLVRTAPDGSPVAVAFLRVLREDVYITNPARGVGWTVLAYSRDCATWLRQRTPWFAGIPGTVDQSIAWVWGACEHNGTLYASYTAQPDGHKVGERYVALATMPSTDLVLQ